MFYVDSQDSPISPISQDSLIINMAHIFFLATFGYHWRLLATIGYDWLLLV